ncbi:MAG: CPBP family glutamic-type intramembrane protease [SAR324 cluster bacterium]|jgi:membrane protease YdiL (CAAX protease family)|nr:CPBP family glutamic-type intramembrane protease [SAR324 cluster bacterium]MDP6522135.1 CPBP family glutamic-type intramembrane protease [SAR324 cluster bacterium]|tara:strand:+ start:156 stop:851 length:696 start_codon:yes stop_codon:yes gene_type:complete
MSNYWRYSRSAYYSAVAALPLLVIYEILIVLSQSRYWGIRNAADVWIRTFLMAFDLQAQHITFVLIGISLALIPIAKSRARGIKLKANYFALMFAECLTFSLILGVVLQSILRLGGLSSGGPGSGLMQNLALSVGAGLFEEIIFRVILLNLLFLLLSPLLKKKVVTAVVSVLLASFLFSLSHYVGTMADTWQLYSFMFRWGAGLLFTVLYFVRGFAITAYTHALYDIWVLV